MYALKFINNIIESFLYNYDICKSYYKSVSNILSGYSNTWCFVNGNSFPILKSNINNFDDLSIEWEYNNINNTLYNGKEEEECVQATLKVLSMNIKINDKSYSADNFVERLRIKTSSIRAPTLQLIFNAWCIFSNTWYSTSDNIIIEIIDNNGECQTLDLTKNNRCLRIYKNSVEFL